MVGNNILGRVFFDLFDLNSGLGWCKLCVVFCCMWFEVFVELKQMGDILCSNMNGIYVVVGLGFVVVCVVNVGCIFVVIFVVFNYLYFCWFVDDCDVWFQVVLFEVVYQVLCVEIVDFFVISKGEMQRLF